MGKKQNYYWDQLTIGVCYYPEHWQESLWEDDLRRMKEAGISTVRIGEFAWTPIEPREGGFTFGLFDRFLDLCGKMEMKVIFGTPTATPPVWLTEKYPEVLNAREDGTLLRHGGRRHYNYNSEKYRELCRRIVENIAGHYAQHPAIVGWQIDNELNCETNEFHSEADSAAFRIFLQEKYGSLEKLNREWGTIFWNQTYTDWEQIYVPRTVLNRGYNPHQYLDYIRFISASTIAFCRMQADIIRKYRKDGDFITTNGLFDSIDNHKMEKECLDVYTYDSYPDMAFMLDNRKERKNDLFDRRWSRNLCEVRSVCPHFGIMEQQSGAGGWTTRMEAAAPKPGQMTLWAMQSIAHGADYISFFRWRTCCFGTEIYWHGILDYDGRDNRRLAELKTFHKKLQAIQETCGAKYCAAFALVKDYDNQWDCSVDAWHRRVNQASEEQIFYTAEVTHTPYDVVYLSDDNVGDDNTSDETVAKELSAYPLLLYPHPVIMTEKRAELLKHYVEQGGILVLGCRSGYKYKNGQCAMMPQPGYLSALTGTTVKEFTFLSESEEPVLAEWKETSVNTPEKPPKKMSMEMQMEMQMQIEMPVFNDVLEADAKDEAVKVLAAYTGSYYAGEPALTEKILGKGRTLHLGAAFNRNNLEKILEYAGVLNPFASLVEAPGGVEVIKKKKDGREYIFLLNFLPNIQRVFLKQEMLSLEEKVLKAGEIELKPYEAAVFSRLF